MNETIAQLEARAEDLRAEFDNAPSSESGLTYARVLELLGRRSEAMAALERAMSAEGDYATESGPHRANYELQHMQSRLAIVLPLLPEEKTSYVGRTPDGRELPCTITAGAGRLVWIERHDGGQVTHRTQSTWEFAALGPLVSSALPPELLVRNLARALGVENAAWVAGYAARVNGQR